MKILITGGTGLIGTEITKQLLTKNHQVVYFSRHPGKNKLNIQEYHWDPDKGEADLAAFENTAAIINLAGANLNQHWTPESKNEILRSRADSTRLLFDLVHKNKIHLKSFISASAVGYYPDSFENVYSEGDPPGNSFLSMVCRKWEQEAQLFEQLNIRTVRCRIGIVLSKEGGALPKMLIPVKLGLGSPLGSGRQWMPWIHIADAAGIFVFALENESLSGVYNTVGPYSVTNEEFMKEAAAVLEKPFFMPKVPATALKLALGEQAEMALSSTNVSNTKISKAGYNYQFTQLQPALENLLK